MGLSVAGMGETSNAHRIIARRDMQIAYWDEMWVENLRWSVRNISDTCDTQTCMRGQY